MILSSCPRQWSRPNNLSSMTSVTWRLLAILCICLSTSFTTSFFTPSSSSSLLLPVSGAYVSGRKYTSEPWVYLQKFCFDESGGTVQFTFFQDNAWDSTDSPQMISFYANDFNGWHHVYKNNALTCAQKRDAAKLTYPLAHLKAYGNTYQYPVGGVIPRWWYIAISNCDGGHNGTLGGLGISYYKIHFTNRTGIWSYEFSKDEQGILEMSIFFLLLYWILLFVLAWIKRHAKGKGLQYTVIKFLFMSVLVDWVALLFNMAHYARFSQDGIGSPGLSHAHFFFDFISNLILLYTVLNICKGWAISTNYLPDKRASYLIILLLFWLYVALFIWQQKILDPASVLYVYETPPGWAIVAVRCILTLWAFWCLIHTYQLESERSKRQFYLVWGFLALAWLISLPIIVGIATNLETWMRKRVVFGILNSVQAFIYLALTYLFRPFRSNRYVSILKPDEARAFGNNNMQIFPSMEPIVEFTNI